MLALAVTCGGSLLRGVLGTLGGFATQHVDVLRFFNNRELDTTILGAAFRSIVAGDRLALAKTSGLQVFRLDALTDQIVTNRLGASL